MKFSICPKCNSNSFEEVRKWQYHCRDCGHNVGDAEKLATAVQAIMKNKSLALYDFSSKKRSKDDDIITDNVVIAEEINPAKYIETIAKNNTPCPVCLPFLSEEKQQALKDMPQHIVDSIYERHNASMARKVEGGWVCPMCNNTSFLVIDARTQLQAASVLLDRKQAKLASVKQREQSHKEALIANERLTTIVVNELHKKHKGTVIDSNVEDITVTEEYIL